MTSQTREILELLFKIKQYGSSGKIETIRINNYCPSFEKKFCSLSFPTETQFKRVGNLFFFQFLKPEQSDPDCLNICEDHILWICFINFFSFPICNSSTDFYSFVCKSKPVFKFKFKFKFKLCSFHNNDSKISHV